MGTDFLNHCVGGVCMLSEKSHSKYSFKIKWKWKNNYLEELDNNESQNRNNDERFKCSYSGELI